MSIRSGIVALALSAAAIVGAGALGSACGPADFDSATKIASVRILATKADKPYAKPGDSVNLEVLAYDGRPDTSRPMKVYWIPFPCINPRNDLYYACFAQAAASGDAGADAGAQAGGGGGKGGQGIPIGGLLKPGIDLTPFLTVGTKYRVDVPADIIDKHPPVPGTADPYGLIILFNVACAGHLEIVDIDPAGGPQQVPLGCFDDNHVKLGPSDYVIGFTRVYAYATRTNANPVIVDVVKDGNPVPLGDPSDPNALTDPSNGITLAHCGSDCTDIKLDVVVAPQSQEDNPGDVDPNGVQHKEEIWVDYYATDGDLEGEARLLYEPKVGKLDDSEMSFHPPSSAKEGFVFVVVHDNRDGVDWRQIPLHVK
jgi:hypothetical protein